MKQGSLNFFKEGKDLISVLDKSYLKHEFRNKFELKL